MVEINIYLWKIPLDDNKNICHALATTHNGEEKQCVSYQSEQLGKDTTVPKDPCLLCAGTANSFNKYARRAKVNSKHMTLYIFPVSSNRLVAVGDDGELQE